MNGFRWKYALPLYYRHLIGRTWGFTIHRDIFSVGRTHEHKDWPAENAELSEICCVHCWNGQPSNNVIIILPQKYHREIANADKLVFYYSLYMFFFCSKAPHMDEWTEPRKEDIDCRCERGHCENMHYMWRVCGDQRIYGARSSHPIFTKLWKHRRWPAMGDYYWFSLECSHPCDSDMVKKKKAGTMESVQHRISRFGHYSRVDFYPKYCRSKNLHVNTIFMWRTIFMVIKNWTKKKT